MSSSSHKNGKVEQNNGAFRIILNKTIKDSCHKTLSTVISRVSFLTNSMCERSFLNASHLAKECTASVSGLQGGLITDKRRTFKNKLVRRERLKKS